MKIPLLGIGVTMIGFVVGFSIGQRTRESAETNTTIDHAGGVVTIKIDAGKSLKDGASRAIKDLFGF